MRTHSITCCALTGWSPVVESFVVRSRSSSLSERSYAAAFAPSSRSMARICSCGMASFSAAALVFGASKS
jgi:hypothetical protein